MMRPNDGRQPGIPFEDHRLRQRIPFLSSSDKTGCETLRASWVATFSVYGPDCFLFTCCTFIQIQFIKLQHDMEKIVKEGSKNREDSTTNTFKADLVEVVIKHRQLMRCVELLETITSKATLLHVMTSSLIICAAGFNLMSMGVGDAIYNSRWYETGAAERKYLLIVLLRFV
ncbi:unnamed protein product [Spodoptera exigua]|nr:unnamed protein product [Spodoptera exigua]